jgi:AraC-like DNA-binding protein
VLETWDWYVERFTDSKVRRYLQEHLFERRPDAFGQMTVFARRWTSAAIASAIGMSERRVARSLRRLENKREARELADGWEIRKIE